MSEDRFDLAVEHIRETDRRYHKDAYAFINDAVAYTVRKCRKENPERPDRHVSGVELIYGAVELAVSQFGVMAPEVFREWGITTGPAIGDIVFNLIHEGIMTASERDSKEDFNAVSLLEPLFPKLPRLPRVSRLPKIDI